MLSRHGVALLCLVLAGLGVSSAGWTDGGSLVTIDNFKFSPMPLTISKGTEVTWKNQDDIPHSIVLQSVGEHSKPLDSDDTFSYRFDKAGTFAYICGLHPFMHGQVIVK